MNKNTEFCNDILYSKFEKIKENHQGKIKSLDEELTEHGYFHTFLNLRKEYSDFICDLKDLFDEYNYCVPYELYDFFYQVSILKYGLLFTYAEYVEGSGNLPGAFLKEAITDIELWSIDTLLMLEKTNNYKNGQLLSIEIYDAILEAQKDFLNCIGYALNEKNVSQSYAFAAHNILLFLGKETTDKAYEYYKTAFELLESSRTSSEYNSQIYYTYYTTLYIFLYQYKSDIEEYGVACDFDIDQKIYDCLHDNYRQAQETLARYNDCLTK